MDAQDVAASYTIFSLGAYIINPITMNFNGIKITHWWEPWIGKQVQFTGIHANFRQSFAHCTFVFKSKKQKISLYWPC